MNSGLGDKHICFHNIVLGTVVTTDLVCVAIVITISVPEVTVSVLAWSTHQVESSDAPAVRLAKVNVILDRATKKVWSVVLLWVHVGSLREDCSVVVWDSDPVST